MIHRVRRGVRRRLTAAVIVGVLTLSPPAGRPVPLTAPPAIVRVQTAAAGALVWRERFPPRSPPN